jgi:hypothetical protein
MQGFWTGKRGLAAVVIRAAELVALLNMFCFSLVRADMGVAVEC